MTNQQNKLLGLVLRHLILMVHLIKWLLRSENELPALLTMVSEMCRERRILTYFNVS